MELLAIIDYAFFGQDFLSVAKKTEPYASMIWFRIKETDEIVYENAIKLRKALPSSVLILSEKSEIAYAVGFNGVHLNMRSQSPKLVKLNYPKLITGFSCHSPEECILSQADYKTLSPIFDPAKPFKTKELGPVKAPCDNVFALGGINCLNYNLLKDKGYRGIAGIRLCNEIENFFRE